MTDYHFAWWNLENLFDVENSPNRTTHLQNIVGSELAGWDQNVLSKKIAQLSSIIQQMNNGIGPDLLGVCEVENKPVMDLLIASLGSLNRNYQVAHHDCSDGRGIDVAFIYDGDKFSFQGDDFHVILKRTATRDLYKITLQSTSGNELVLIGNHWPARTGSEYKTEPYRIIAAETLGYWNSRIIDASNDDPSIFIMGDFNDNPYNRSLIECALSTNSKKKVVNSQIPRIYNLMWPIMAYGLGTFYWDNFPYVYDQFMVSKGFLKNNASFTIDPASITLEKYPEMIKPGSTYEVPRRFGRPSKSYDKEGYSDHYPISIKVTET